MILLRQRLFSKKKKEKTEKKKENRDGDVMVGAGKVGLGAGAIAGTGAAVEGGKSLYHFYKGAKKGKKVIQDLADNPELARKIESTAKNIMAENGIGSINFPIKQALGGMKNLKHSKIGATKFAYNTWKGLANEKVPRIILLNAEDMSKRGIDALSRNASEKTKEALSGIPKAVGHLSKSAISRRNMKYLGKSGAKLAAAGGALYVNGRFIQQGGRGGSTIGQEEKDK